MNGNRVILKNRIELQNDFRQIWFLCYHSNVNRLCFSNKFSFNWMGGTLIPRLHLTFFMTADTIQQSYITLSERKNKKKEKQYWKSQKIKLSAFKRHVFRAFLLSICSKRLHATLTVWVYVTSSHNMSAAISWTFGIHLFKVEVNGDAWSIFLRFRVAGRFLQHAGLRIKMQCI